MSFGVSPNLQRTEMVGADVAVVWVDKNTGKGYAHDYYLDDKSQCSGSRGSCPDTRIEVRKYSSQVQQFQTNLPIFLRITPTRFVS